MNEPEALRLWQLGRVDPSLLYQLGRKASSRGLPDIAFLYYRSAAQLDPAGLGEGHFLEGRLCQSYLADLKALSFTNQRYCQRYFADNSHNIVLNGQFGHNTDQGWNGASFFADPSKASIALDETEGVPAPSLMLRGLTPGRHAGIYQRIALQPGTKVRFSGHFRTENASDLESWLLYVEWRQTDKIHGTHFFTGESDMGWTYLEWTLTVPVGSEPWMNFYPVLLIGQGTVWSDGISVEILPE